MCSDVAEVLSPEQRALSDELCDSVAQRYLPIPTLEPEQPDGKRAKPWSAASSDGSTGVAG